MLVSAQMVNQQKKNYSYRSKYARYEYKHSCVIPFGPIISGLMRYMTVTVAGHTFCDVLSKK